MPPRPGPASQEGYPSSSPSTENHQSDPFAAQPRQYYDNESDYGRRDTYASDSSNPGMNDNGYYDNNGVYDPYRAPKLALSV